jgi:hypothetical protein
MWLSNGKRDWQEALHTFLKTRRPCMAIGTKVAEAVKGWTVGKLVGFSESKTGEYLIAKFRLQNGDFCSMVYNNPIKLKDINNLVSAMGLETYTEAADIILPEKDDPDMMGMDVDIQINVKEKGDFLNATAFKPSGQAFNGQF